MKEEINEVFAKVKTFAITCKQIGEEQSEFFKEINHF